MSVVVSKIFNILFYKQLILPSYRVKNRTRKSSRNTNDLTDQHGQLTGVIQKCGAGRLGPGTFGRRR